MSKKKNSEFDFDFDFKLDGSDVVSENAPAEISAEIRSIRDRNKEFEATNEHETYCIISFSTKKDKELFLDNLKINEHTLIDGYLMARQLNIEPKKPSFALHPPMTGGK